MDKNKLSLLEEHISTFDTEIKCIAGFLEIIHLGMLSMYNSNDDFDTFELSFLHILKSCIYDLSEHNIKELQAIVAQLK